MMANREFSNKLPRYRKVILSYAQGDILECGVATGHTFQHYQKENVKSYIGIDWSSNMLLQAFQKLEELGPKSFSHGEDKKFFKLMQADTHELPFENNQFDTVVDILTLQSVYDIETSFSEIKRVCKPGGNVLIIARGQSWIPIYNKWL